MKLKEDYKQVGNDFLDGFIRGAFDMEELEVIIDFKLAKILSKFPNKEEEGIWARIGCFEEQLVRSEYKKVFDELCLRVNREVKTRVLRTLKEDGKLENLDIL